MGPEVKRHRALRLLLLAFVAWPVACDALRTFGPPADEMEAMEEREAAMKAAGDGKSFVVFPVRVHDRVDAEGGAELARLIEQRGLGSARALPDGPWFELRPSMNEQSPLWEVARRFRDYVRTHPQGEDYALYADYWMNAEKGEVLAVHCVVVDRAGEWVLVAFQNSHQGEFRQIAPRSRLDCARLVLEELE
jgi:hypothetical protein